MDRFYTPPQLAEKVVRMACSDALPERVADFAAGSGGLLHAALTRWPGAEIVATDIDRQAVEHLRRSNATWRVGKCDFLNRNSRARCRVLSEIRGGVPLVLLNPPFSCRGGRRWSAGLNGTGVRVSKALAFVITAISYLAPEGQIVAILPAGTVRSDGDRRAWELLRAICCCKSAAMDGRKTFAGCYPQTIIVRLKLRSRHVRLEKVRLWRSAYVKATKATTVSIIRGTFQMHTLQRYRSSSSVPLLHTTSLDRTEVVAPRVRVSTSRRKVRGPAVLLPRVGQPDPAKICLYMKKEPVALSDCVLALRCTTCADARSVRQVLLKNWGVLETLYGGTCARYITIMRLTNLLESCGLSVTSASSDRS